MVGWGIAAWVACAEERGARVGEPPPEDELVTPLEYAGCAHHVVASTWYAEPVVETTPNYVDETFDDLGWQLTWTVTESADGTVLQASTWGRRPDGQETEYAYYRAGGWLDRRSVSAYDDDGLLLEYDLDEDGDGDVDLAVDYVNEGGLTVQERMDDGADGVVDWVYVLTYDALDRLVGRSGRHDSVDGPEFHQESWTQGDFGWTRHEVTVFLYAHIVETRAFDALGRETRLTTEQAGTTVEYSTEYAGDELLPAAGAVDVDAGDLRYTTTWSIERDELGRPTAWYGETDDGSDGSVDSTDTEEGTWDCP